MRYTDEELLEYIRDWYDEHGETPTSTMIEKDDSLPSISTYQYRFESWTAAVEAAGLIPQKPPHSDEELLDLLREYVTENDGIPPTQADIDEDDILPSAVTYHHRFGSVNTAIKKAGFKPRNPTYSDEDLLAYIRDWNDEHGYPPTHQDMVENDSLPSPTTFHNHFGSLNEAIEAAGLTPRKSRGVYSDEELLDILRDWNGEYGRPPTIDDMNKADSLPSHIPYYTHFGSWSVALEEAGLTPRKTGSRYSDEELLSSLRDYTDKHGTLPTISKVEEDESLPSPATYATRFGSWNNAIKAAGLTPLTISPEC